MTRVYGLPSDSSTPHVQTTSSGTADVKTVAPPGRATACYLSATTNSCFVTFDGSTPSSTNGLPVLAALQPVLLQLAGPLKVASSAAGGTTLNVLWLE